MTEGVPCPCCGRPVDATENPEALIHILSPTGGVILRRILKANGGPVATEALIAACYDHRPDGGPLDALDSLSAIISQNNRKLRRYGWRIRGRLGRASRGYALETLALEPEQVGA